MAQTASLESSRNLPSLAPGFWLPSRNDGRPVGFSRSRVTAGKVPVRGRVFANCAHVYCCRLTALSSLVLYPLPKNGSLCGLAFLCEN